MHSAEGDSSQLFRCAGLCPIIVPPFVYMLAISGHEMIAWLQCRWPAAKADRVLLLYTLCWHATAMLLLLKIMNACNVWCPLSVATPVQLCTASKGRHPCYAFLLPCCACCRTFCMAPSFTQQQPLVKLCKAVSAISLAY